MSHVPMWAVGLAIALAISLAAFRVGALTWSGVIVATAAGTAAMVAGWSWAVVLVSYFVAATLISRIGAVEKQTRAAGRVAKQGARDGMQVWANGGVFVIASLAYAGGQPRVLWQCIAAGALAASAADTWATELGMLSRSQPRSILGGAPVPPGTSGGITLAGLAAGAAAAGFLAILAWLVRWPVHASLAAIVGGVVGNLLDSLLGAGLQSQRWCPNCAAATEQRVHRCGTVTEHTAGLRWLDNDAVNALATVGGGAAGAAVWLAAAA